MVQDPAPGPLYLPAGHTAAVVLTDPAAHAYPAVHSPEHDADVRPADDPKVPAGQLLHDPDPATENLPAGHCTAVADVDPATHTYPALHSPLHAADVSPVILPYVPAGHCAVQDALVSPAVEPNVPTGHSVQLPAPAKLYLPTAHTAAVGLVDPAAHAYPALQPPVHPLVVRPCTAPYSPAAHSVHVPDPAVL